MKYKVGDKVQITDDVNRYRRWGLPLRVMNAVLGEIGVVVDAYAGIYGVNIGCLTILLPDEMIRGISENEESESIVIYRNGQKTIAVRKKNGKVVKDAVARCNPTDEYDFNKGAELAYNRLVYGTDYHPSEVAFKGNPIESIVIKRKNGGEYRFNSCDDGMRMNVPCFINRND